MKKTTWIAIAAALAWANAAEAGPPKDPPTSCAPDAVLVGPTCVDKYEASIWLVPPTNLAGKSNKGLIKSIRKGKAMLADLTAGNATQLGCFFGQTAYPAGFPETGNWVPDPVQPVPPSPGVYAVSIPGVLPSTCTTWFQAEQACALSGKRLLSNQEWQRAAASTPDPGTDNGTTDCVVSSGPSNTGARTNCVSAWGVNDMVGNVGEWVADWGDLAIACTDWTSAYSGGLPGGDFSCVGGDGNSAPFRVPGAFLRGGYWALGTFAGVFAIVSGNPAAGGPFAPEQGLRCAR